MYEVTQTPQNTPPDNSEQSDWYDTSSLWRWSECHISRHLQGYLSLPPKELSVYQEVILAIRNKYPLSDWVKREANRLIYARFKSEGKLFFIDGGCVRRGGVTIKLWQDPESGSTYMGTPGKTTFRKISEK